MLFTKGKDIHKDCLTSFELALREAEIADLNLVSVSSILPPRCKIVSRQEGRKYLRQGQVLGPPPTSPTGWLPRRSASQGRLTKASTGTCRSTAPPAKPRKRPANTLRTLRWRCSGHARAAKRPEPCVEQKGGAVEDIRKNLHDADLYPVDRRTQGQTLDSGRQRGCPYSVILKS